MSAQKWDKDIIQPYEKGHDVSVMIWTVIWRNGRSDLVRLTRDQEAKKKSYSANPYIEVLKENLIGLYELGMSFM